MSTPKLADLKGGLTLWLDNHGPHPAVVIRAGDTSVTVICGTGTQKNYPEQFCMKPNTPAGRILGLSKPTYFYPSGVAILTDPTLIQKVHGSCPLGVFFELEKLAQVAAKRFKPQVAAAKVTVAASQSHSTDATNVSETGTPATMPMIVPGKGKP